MLAALRWTRDAACLGLVSPRSDPWHDEDPAGQAAAKLVCAGCPVLADCQAYALRLLETAEVQGVYAGLTPAELRAFAREHGYPARKVAQHGTRARYVAGCRCAACRRANATGEHARRRPAA